MRNRADWKPTKFVMRGGRLSASMDASELAVASRLSADLVAERYGSLLPRYATGRLLDLGCGKVPLFEAYRDHVSEIVCADWSPAEGRAEHLDVICDAGRPLPFADGAFDTIVLSSVLEHIPEPAALARELARVLSPNGMLVLNVPFYYGIHEAPHDYYRFTRYGLNRLFSVAGFDIVLIEEVGGAAEALVDILGKTTWHAGRLGRLLSALLQRAGAIARRSGWVRRLSRRTGTRIPLNYFLVASRR